MAGEVNKPDSDGLNSHRERIERDGYTILPGVIEAGMVEELRADIARLEIELDVAPAANEFEGTRTRRIYNLLARGAVYEQVPVHDRVLPLVERVLDAGCLVSSLSSIAIGPGESKQPIHADDQLIPIDRPHSAVVCNTMWALTDFTEENGATRLVPGSHRFAEAPDFEVRHGTVAAEMEAGSVLVWHGSLWHGGGANRTDRVRVGLAMNYCAGFIRQQENQQLGIPLETVSRFSPRLRELTGFTTYNGLIGHIDTKTPAERLLGDADETKLVWEV